jgi:hypothetical protein
MLAASLGLALAAGLAPRAAASKVDSERTAPAKAAPAPAAEAAPAAPAAAGSPARPAAAEAAPPSAAVTVLVTADPGVAILTASRTAVFTATVSGEANTAVTWAVDGVPGGNATVGTLIPGDGNTAIYTAPARPGRHTVTATSVADASRNAVSIVHVLVSGGGAGITPVPAAPVSVAPAAGSVNAGGTLALSATVADGNPAVTWIVDGVTNGNAQVGTITPGAGNTATYTAPAAPGSHAVNVVSAADASRSAVSLVTVLLPVQATVSPAAASLMAGGTVTLTATVTGAADPAVTWTVDGVANGNASVGTITPGQGDAATYTAPAGAGTHSVAAVSAADTTKAAVSTITVETPVRVAMNLGSATLGAGGTFAITATVSGAANTAVTWTVDGISGGNADVGTVVPMAGNTVSYTAPAAPGSHTLKATSSADPTKSATTVVTIQAS